MLSPGPGSWRHVPRRKDRSRNQPGRSKEDVSTPFVDSDIWFAPVDCIPVDILWPRKLDCIMHYDTLQLQFLHCALVPIQRSISIPVLLYASLRTGGCLSISVRQEHGSCTSSYLRTLLVTTQHNDAREIWILEATTVVLPVHVRMSLVYTVLVAVCVARPNLDDSGGSAIRRTMGCVHSYSTAGARSIQRPSKQKLQSIWGFEATLRNCMLCLIVRNHDFGQCSER